MIRNLYIVCDAPIGHVVRVLHEGPPEIQTKIAAKLAARAAHAHESRHPDCRAENITVANELDEITSGKHILKFKVRYKLPKE